MTTEKDIRGIIQEELDRREAEKQAACRHARSGTLCGDVIVCDQCGLELDPMNPDYGDDLGASYASGRLIPADRQGH